MSQMPDQLVPSGDIIIGYSDAAGKGRVSVGQDECEEVTAVIDAYKDRFAVEPICRVLEVPTST
jgi:hypothetical protein